MLPREFPLQEGDATNNDQAVPGAHVHPRRSFRQVRCLRGIRRPIINNSLTSLLAAAVPEESEARGTTWRRRGSARGIGDLGRVVNLDGKKYPTLFRVY